MIINNKEYKEIKLLGKGKSAYSYLILDEHGFKYVAKKIHHEPCNYYHFDDKLQVEIDDYNFLKDFLSIPKLIDVDMQNEILLKEYIEGLTIKEMLDLKMDITDYYNLIVHISSLCYEKGINIDYYPSNFIPKNYLLYYIDYECNQYDSKWNFDNWGKQYWKLK